MNLHDLLRFLELSDLGRHAAATVKAPELPTITPEAWCTDPDLPGFLDVFSKCGQASYIKLQSLDSRRKTWRKKHTLFACPIQESNEIQLVGISYIKINPHCGSTWVYSCTKLYCYLQKWSVSENVSQIHRFIIIFPHFSW
jgi:hypothetical protein